MNSSTYSIGETSAYLCSIREVEAVRAVLSVSAVRYFQTGNISTSPLYLVSTAIESLGNAITFPYLAAPRVWE